MYHQMDIFDFIEKLPEQEKLPEKTQFEQRFEKVRNPVVPCANCLCRYCANNAENVWRTVKPEEMQRPCFNCDECRIYDGDCRSKNQRKEECMSFAISEYGSDYIVQQNRKKIRLIKC